MENFTLKKNDKFLISGTLKECMYYFLSIEDNTYHAFIHKGYNLYKGAKLYILGNEEQTKFEKEYRKKLFFKRFDKIKSVIDLLGLEFEDRSEAVTNGYYYPNNINLYGNLKNGNCILFSMAYNNKNKITVSPHFSRDKEGKYISLYSRNEKHFSISVSCEKDIQKIKKDVEKRFMPTFEELQEKHKKIADSTNGYINNTLFNMEILKGQPLTDSEKHSKTFYTNNANIRCIDVYGDSVTIKLYSLTVDQAQKIIEVLS